MEWQDEGTLIASRPHGETSAIIEVFTALHGRHAGVVRGGASRKVSAMMQAGSQVAVRWRARLDDHLGVFHAEPLRSRAGLMEDRLALAGLNAVCAMLRFALPERAAYPDLYTLTQSLLARLDGTDWAGDYLRWELALLEETGFGLDLGRCAVTGSREDLAFVSPRTGRAVSRAAAADWAPRLLPLPAGLLGQGPLLGGELAQGLAITGHFLERELAVLHHGRSLPEPRARLVDLLTRGL
ncbi:UNVERIFIED_CONTAM: recO [Trichonephila clavipes]